MAKFIVIGFYTDKYSDKAYRLMVSAKKFGIPYDLVRVQDVHSSISTKGLRGSDNTKPNLILAMMNKYPNIKSFVYMDSDMVIRNYPNFSDEMLNGIDNYMCNWEGTTDKIVSIGAVKIYSNNDTTKEMLSKWHHYCKIYPNIPDDVMLDKIHNNIEKFPNLQNLPPQFCDAIISKAKGEDVDLNTTIFEHPDTMSDNTKREYTAEERRFLNRNNNELSTYPKMWIAFFLIIIILIIFSFTKK